MGSPGLGSKTQLPVISSGDGGEVVTRVLVPPQPASAKARSAVKENDVISQLAPPERCWEAIDVALPFRFCDPLAD
jgi:hypothetical protein